jgi:hypothetical protein
MTFYYFEVLVGETLVTKGLVIAKSKANAKSLVEKRYPHIGLIIIYETLPE